MFEFFKNKVKVDPIVSKTSDLLARSAEMLHLQLVVCKTDTVAYEKFVDSIFFTGYTSGFFDATLQYSGLRPSADEKVFKLLVNGFLHFFNGDANKAIICGERYLRNQDDPVFDEARTAGGKEYYDLMDQKIRIPAGLSNKFHSI